MAQARGPRRHTVVDAGLATLCAALSASILAGPAFDDDVTGPGPWLLAGAHAGALAWRRRAPLAAFAASVAAAAAYLAAGWPMVGLGLTPLVVVYSLAAARPPRASLPGLGTAAAVLVVASAAGGVLPQADTLAGNVIGLAAAWLLGDGSRRRSEVAALHEQRAAALEAAQAELARRAVAEERLRIARELHDVVAHSMSVISVQAGTARLVLDDDPDTAREALATIEASSRAALDEMRHLLGVLRGNGDAPAPRAPVPTLAQLEELVEATSAGGTPVDLSVDGERRPLPPGIEVAAYRIVQEALTNVRRHAPGRTATVAVAYERNRLRVRIENDLPARAPAGRGPGHGITGMRERATMYGGTLDAGTTAAGTFRVDAVLPIEEPSP